MTLIGYLFQLFVMCVLDRDTFQMLVVAIAVLARVVAVPSPQSWCALGKIMDSTILLKVSSRPVVAFFNLKRRNNNEHAWRVLEARKSHSSSESFSFALGQLAVRL